ncbi:MAG: rhodanese-like domain-containing protein [Desulfobulbaceae bacterium]|nr:rhodanese-like domain-containing protein [Desulfobulbaceae bacterium]
MGLMDFFKSPPTISTTDVKELLDEKGQEGVNLIDVRQPGEYEKHHLAGARLIPLGELQSRLDEIDTSKPTVIY